jgi:hypothetical protein
MGDLKPGATYIYESPDGGETVYAREAGSTNREMIGQSTKAKSLLEKMQEDKLWGEIRRAAKQDIILQNMLNEVEVYFRLKKPDA